MDGRLISYCLNYVLIGLSGVTGSYLLLRSTFQLRRPPVLWCVYFLIKTVADALLWYTLSQSAVAGWVETFQAVWLFVMGCASLLVVCRTFVGDFVLVALCAVVCDLIAAICMSFAAILANIICGAPFDAGYINPFGARTVLTSVGVVAAVLCLRVPVSWISRWMCRLAQRNRVAWSMAAVFIALFFVTLTQRFSSYVSIDSNWSLVLPFATTVMAVIAITLLRRARDMNKREEIVRQCVELADSYDHAVRLQLEELEQELSALEGHEMTLDVLERQSECGSNRVGELQLTYQHLMTGAYCDHPALDAVLSACARRLGAMGARPSFTVAAIPKGMVLPATVALALLHLACEAAERTDAVSSEGVDLRIRGIGNQVLLRLAVPREWGALWAKRYLSAFDTGGFTLIRERKEGSQRVVLVLTGPEAT